MDSRETHILDCSAFEEMLTEYLDGSLDSESRRSTAEHALACPLCHSLLNDVKESLDVCRELNAPAVPMTRLEGRILSMTAPETAMSCSDFEDALTDYLDGFLPAAAFHRWERHAALCTSCEDTPGMVVRSIAACYTYKLDELAMPAGLHERILLATIGTEEAADIRRSLGSAVGEWFRGLRLPFAVPQLAPVAMIMMLAFMIFSQTVSADGTLTNAYSKGIELAGQTFQQGASAFGTGAGTATPPPGEPLGNTIDVKNGESR
jgi:anti-sigma factor RsiW